MTPSTNGLSGVITPVVTPFTNDEPDIEALASNLRAQDSTGVAGYLALGSNGEFRSLSEREAEKVMEVFGEGKNGKQLLVGAGSESTSQTIRTCRVAASHGADYASVITPSYFARIIDDAVMLRYFTAVADASPIPVVLYNIPESTGGIQISPAVLGQLARHPNIRGIKDSSPVGPSRYLAVLEPGSDFRVLSGSIATFYPSLCLGASGGVLSLANVIPDLCVRLYRHCTQGEHEAARSLHFTLTRLNQCLAGKYGVPGVKAAMEMMGLRGASPRLPLVPLSEEQRQGVRRALQEAGALPR